MKSLFLNLSLLAVVSLITSTASAYRIAMVNDVHSDLNYNPSNTGQCISKVVNPNSTNA